MGGVSGLDLAAVPGALQAKRARPDVGLLQTPASYKDRMDRVLDQILRASSQQEAQDRFKNLREELAEEAPSALEVLEDGLYEATAVLALPDKYRRRLRTTKRDPSDLSRRSVAGKNRFGSFQAWSLLVGLLGPSAQRPTRSGRRGGATSTWRSSLNGGPLTLRRSPLRKTSPTIRSYRRRTQPIEMKP